jgi:predicted neuraminidase/peroxiredoxin
MFAVSRGARWALFLALSAPAQVEIGGRAGPVTLEGLDGSPVTITNYGERPVTAVLFLSARCEATREAVRLINDVNDRYRLGGLLLVGIFANPAEDGEEVRRFAQSSGLLFPVYRDPGQRAAKRFGARVTPEAFLLDTDGVLRYRGAVSGLGAAFAMLMTGQRLESAAAPAAGTPLGARLPKRELADPYGAISFRSELIFETIPGAPAHHASVLAEAPNGDLLAVWYGGSYESSDDQTLFLARRRQGARIWDQPRVLVRDSAQPPGNAVVFTDGAGRVWIIWARMEASRPLRRGGGWNRVRLMYRTSSDHGLTWSPDQPLNAGVEGLPRNPPVLSAARGLLLPLAGAVDGAQASFFLQSKDHGRSWLRSGAAAGGGQPALVERKDGSLLMLMRKRPRILRSESHDGGLNWTPAEPTELRNPDSGLSMTALANGHLVVVFNDSETARTPLSIARSLDGGKTWERPLTLEANPGEYSYPCVIQTSDGRIHVTYTFRRYSIKHVELNEDWLAHTGRPN